MKKSIIILFICILLLFVGLLVTQKSYVEHFAVNGRGTGGGGNTNLYTFNSSTATPSSSNGSPVRLHFLSKGGGVTCEVGKRRYKLTDLLDVDKGKIMSSADYLTKAFIPNMTVTKITITKPTSIQKDNYGSNTVTLTRREFTSVTDGVFNKQTGMMSFVVKDMTDPNNCLQDDVTMLTVPAGSTIKEFALDVVVEGTTVTTVS